MLGFHCCFFCCFSITSEFHLHERHTVPGKGKYKLFVAEQTLLTLNFFFFSDTNELKFKIETFTDIENNHSYQRRKG